MYGVVGPAVPLDAHRAVIIDVMDLVLEADELIGGVTRLVRIGNRRVHGPIETRFGVSTHPEWTDRQTL